MNKYERYKKVDLPWLEEVPEHWEVSPISHVFEERKEKNQKGDIQFILSVIKNRGVIPYTEKGSVGNKASENIENYSELYVNPQNAVYLSIDSPEAIEESLKNATKDREIRLMVVADAVARMIPGVLGAASGAQEDSFYEPLLECPQYTKPPEFRGWAVPDVLRSGHHKNIATWRQKEALKRTRLLRPDLLERPLTKEEVKLLKEIVHANILTKNLLKLLNYHDFLQ